MSVKLRCTQTLRQPREDVRILAVTPQPDGDPRGPHTRLLTDVRLLVALDVLCQLKVARYDGHLQDRESR